MIKISELDIPTNYVAVKADEDYDNYQVDGRDTGIKSGLAFGTAGQRVSIFGTVVKAPNKLVFLGDEIRETRNIYGDSEQGTDEADLLKHQSVLYDVPVEVKAGDRVMYFYKNHMDAYRNNMVIHTDEGPVMIMRYDTLTAVLLSEDELYPLNGYLFIELKEKATDKQTTAGIHLLEKTHMGVKFKNKMSIGKVIEVGSLVNGYIEFLNEAPDDATEFKNGDFIYFDARMTRNLQFNLHQTLKTPRIVLHRKDIYGIIPQPEKFEFA